MEQFVSGYIRGTGAAVNVSLGWIPDHVKIVNATDGDSITEGFPGIRYMPFTSGGTTEIEPGDTITGATSGATAVVRDVILDTGSWAGGDAAGWLVIDEESKVGTFQSENVYVSSDSTSGTNDAAVTVDVAAAVNTAAAVAADAAGIVAYLGSDTPGSEAAKGFSIDAGVSEDAKLLLFFASRGNRFVNANSA